MTTRIHRSCWVYCPQHHVNKVIKNPLIYIYIYITRRQLGNLFVFQYQWRRRKKGQTSCVQIKRTKAWDSKYKLKKKKKEGPDGTEQMHWQHRKKLSATQPTIPLNDAATSGLPLCHPHKPFFFSLYFQKPH
jgi:hypothetical protein